MISTEDKVFWREMYVMMLDLSLFFAEVFKKHGDPKYREESEFYYQQAQNYKAKLQDVK